MGGCFATNSQNEVELGSEGKKSIDKSASKKNEGNIKTTNRVKPAGTSDIPRNTDSLNSSAGDGSAHGVKDSSNRSASRTQRIDGSRGRDASLSTPSMDTAYRQWDKGTKSPNQAAPLGVHVEDAPGNSRSRDGSDGTDLKEKIQRFKEKHQDKIGEGKSKFSHRRSLSAQTNSSASEESPAGNGRSLFRKRSSTFSIGDSKDASRRRTPRSQNGGGGVFGGGGFDSGRARPFGILSVLKEMNETGSFSRPHSGSLGSLSDLPKDTHTSELTYITTPIVVSQQPKRSNSASPALSSGTSSSHYSSSYSSPQAPDSNSTSSSSSSSSSSSANPSPSSSYHPTPASASTSSSLAASIHPAMTTSATSSSTASTISVSSSFSSNYSKSSPSLSASGPLFSSTENSTRVSMITDSPTKGAEEDSTKPLLVSNSEEQQRKGSKKHLLK